MSANADGARLFGLPGPACFVSQCFSEGLCPGCGLTRSTSLVLQGDWQLAFDLHPGGFLIPVLCLGGILVYLDILRRKKRTDVHSFLLIAGRVSLASGVLIPWAVRAVT